jgi:tetratricopeptide (TPR) repeat protein
VRADVRHQLKEDRFRTATAESAHWAVEHRDTLVKAGIALLVMLAVGVGGWLYLNHRNELAGTELNKALRTYNTPLRPANSPEQPGFPSFSSAAERAKKSHDQFQAIADQYGYTKSGEFARYFTGLSAIDMGDNAGAEKTLKQTADGSSNDLSALAKIALAALYRDSNRETQAIEIYKQLADKPSSTVSKQTAQVELAGLYAAKNQPKEAQRIYEQLQKENPNTEFAALASAKLQELIKK